MRKGPVGRARRQGVTPAVMYGRGEASVNLELGAPQVQQITQTPSVQNVLIQLSIAGGEQPRQETVMIKAIQRHPVSSQVLHIDFMKISMDRPLEIKIPVVITGSARA